MQRMIKFLGIFLVGMTFFALPIVSFAHGEENDGHVEAPVVVASDGHTDHTHGSGESALLVAFSVKWWGLLFVSLGLTTLLSYAVWSYLQVSPKKVSIPSS